MLDPERGPQRLIESILTDGTHHRLSPQVLDIMLDNDRVQQFRRSGGWVNVGRDPIRAKRTSNVCVVEYFPERRAAAHYCHPP